MAASFPRLRWMALAWLVVWVPIYWYYWGGQTFLLLCDVSLALGCLGLFSGDALLVSTQAVATPMVGMFWAADLGWRFFLGHHLMGGTEYMWDTRFPLWTRLASFFHLALPFVLIWALRRLGYDRRAWLAQSGIAATLLAASRLVDPARNLNFAFRDPLFHRSLGPAPLHLTVIFVVLVVVLYGPVHLALARSFPAPQR
jgi:hypothetical protein